MLTTIAMTILTAVFLILGSAYFANHLIDGFKSWNTTKGAVTNLVSIVAFVLAVLIVFGLVRVAGL